MEELWYKKQVTFEDAVGMVRENLGSMVDSFIAAGYWLKRIRDGQEYEEHGYQTIWACAWMEFGLAKSEASRAMSMNDKYSVDGDSPYLAEKYKQYSKSQLQEMLKMSEQQIEQVTPDMTVREIREIKRPAASETDDDGLLYMWIDNFIRSQFYFERLKRIYDERSRIDHKLIHGISAEIDLCLPEMDMRNITMLLEGDIVSLLETDTGEILGKYKSALFDNMLMDAFADEEKSRKESEAAIRCDVATEQVNTCLDEEFEIEVIEELEEDPDQEELSVDFNTDELLEELDTVIDAEFREVEDPEEKSPLEGLSAYGFPKTEYPPDSLLTTKGCGHRYTCFDCAQECGIRQEERYCRAAPLENPYSCMTMNILDILRSDTGISGCQFIDQRLADKTPGGISAPCCKKCPSKNMCGYCCENATQESYGSDGCQSVAMSQQFMQEKEVNAAEMQQELPALKNNDERKQWLREYKNWGLWYRDGNIDVNYYKFDFPDGSRLVVAEYPQRLGYWKAERSDEHYFHLLEKNKMGYEKRYDEQYRQQTDSETYLVEFLKNVQKRGNME